MPKRIRYYVLNKDNEAVPVEGPNAAMVWAMNFSSYSHNRVVAKEEIIDASGEEVEVSTVFLGLDHNHRAVGPPQIFETMVFGGMHDQFCERYATWEEAEEGHERTVNAVIKGEL